MKLRDIKTYTIGNSCFGDILDINGETVYQMPKSDILELILDTIETHPLANLIAEDIVKLILESLDATIEHSESNHCDACGDYTQYVNWVVN